MVIICNGAFKSGSTWLYQIVRKLVDGIEKVPESFQNERWGNEISSVAPDKVEAFLAEYADSQTTYLTKNHLARRSFVPLVTQTHVKTVKLFNIRRDVRDVVVSAYFHHERRNPTGRNFEEFYEAMGQEIARRVDVYHRKWDVESPNIFATSYEEMLHDPVEVVTRIAKFLGLELERERIEEVCEETSFGKWKAKTGSDHLRKGIIGDWKNYLSAEDVEKLRETAGPHCFSALAD
ncbi:MAG: sulfotransferase domain-containing protein [Verrucomicrobiota bacterium]